jgi:hypothetical protein
MRGEGLKKRRFELLLTAGESGGTRHGYVMQGVLLNSLFGLISRSDLWLVSSLHKYGWLLLMGQGKGCLWLAGHVLSRLFPALASTVAVCTIVALRPAISLRV